MTKKMPHTQCCLVKNHTYAIFHVRFQHMRNIACLFLPDTHYLSETVHILLYVHILLLAQTPSNNAVRHIISFTPYSSFKNVALFYHEQCVDCE